MSVSARCIAIGAMVFLYWAAAFATAVADKVLMFEHGRAPREWWNPPWLVSSGYGVGRPILEMLEDFPGWSSGAAIGWPFYGAVLLVAAASMGTGAWLLSALVTGWWLRRKRS
jgi:hypothetical protein